MSPETRAETISDPRVTGQEEIRTHQERPRPPLASTVMALAGAAVASGAIPSREAVENTGRFVGFFLTAVDQNGDEKNYPPKNRPFLETVNFYYAEVLGDKQFSSIEEFQKEMGKRLDSEGINTPEVWDWVWANAAWEHIAGGGNPTSIPQNCERYLRADIGEREIGFPRHDSVRSWESYEEDEKAFSYRVVTNYWFGKAIDSVARPAEKPASSYAQSLPSRLHWAAVMLYQLSTDTHHPKHKQEPTFNQIIHTIRARDPNYSPLKEAVFIARTAQIPAWIACLAYAMTETVCTTMPVADWDQPLKREKPPKESSESRFERLLSRFSMAISSRQKESRGSKRL